MKKFQQFGFSLVEVALALSISVFSLLAVAALMPHASAGQRAAIDTSVMSLISRTLFTEARQADFDALINSPGTVYRYFDFEGLEVPRNRQVYTAEVNITPVVDVPGPSTGRTNLYNLAQIRIRVARNPLGTNPSDSAVFNVAPQNIRVAVNYIARHESQVK